MTKKDIGNSLKLLTDSIPADIKVVAVSKTKSKEDILEAYYTGHLDFGENKVQELLEKHPELPKDIRWHFIGHLQRNKVKHIVDFVYLIQSVDSIRLLKEINKRSENAGRITNCLFQISIADEETKFGFEPDELYKWHEEGELQGMNHIRICGLMGMATNTEDNVKVLGEFKFLKDYFNKLKRNFYSSDDHFKELSMGMTSDYDIAIEAGSNMIRVGSRIFGFRS